MVKTEIYSKLGIKSGSLKFLKKYILSIHVTGTLTTTEKLLKKDAKIGFYSSAGKGDWSQKQVLFIQKSRVVSSSQASRGFVFVGAITAILNLFTKFVF